MKKLKVVSGVIRAGGQDHSDFYTPASAKEAERLIRLGVCVDPDDAPAAKKSSAKKSGAKARVEDVVTLDGSDGGDGEGGPTG